MVYLFKVHRAEWSTCSTGVTVRAVKDNPKTTVSEININLKMAEVKVS